MKLNIKPKKNSIDPKKLIKLVISLFFPIIILILQPLGMNLNQSIIISSLLLVIIWWSTNIVNRNIASLYLLLVFLLFSNAPFKTVFSFPLSENFALITITYLFSQGIANSGLIEKLVEPLLIKYAKRPLTILLLIITMYILTMYVIPQPLARLIIVAMLFRNFISKTDAPEKTKNVLMFSCFLFYAVVNMATKNADIIMNNAAVGFAGLTMTDKEWIQYMTVPVVAFGLMVLGIFIYIFRKNLFGVSLRINDDAKYNDYVVEGTERSTKLALTQIYMMIIVVVTLILWATVPLHGINSTVVTFISTALMFFLKCLRKRDLKAIDITTLIFLTATFSIGGILKFSGTADILFSKVSFLFPKELSVIYILVMILVTMAMHMVLGSNTTTLSVVIPGLIVISENLLPAEIVMFIAYNSVAFHSILPFHAVSMMIGVGNGYFPSSYVAKFGIPITLFIIIGIFLIFIPWWKFVMVLT